MNKPIISFIVLIISISFAFLYVKPAYDTSVERREDIKFLSKILGTSSEIKTLIEETKINLGSIEQSELDRFEVFLPKNIDPIRFANNIQYIGKKNGITLYDIKIDEPTNGATNSSASSGSTASQGLSNAFSLGAKIDKADGAVAQGLQTLTSTSGKYAVTKASFTFTSTFEAFQSFLDDIEKSLGVIDVTSLSFSLFSTKTSANAPRTPPPPMYQYTMTIETYSLK